VIDFYTLIILAQQPSIRNQTSEIWRSHVHQTSTSYISAQALS